MLFHNANSIKSLLIQRSRTAPTCFGRHHSSMGSLLSSSTANTALPSMNNISFDGAGFNVHKKVENIDASLNRIFQRSIQVPHPALFSS